VWWHQLRGALRPAYGRLLFICHNLAAILGAICLQRDIVNTYMCATCHAAGWGESSDGTVDGVVTNIHITDLELVG
jgi:hypothetical protein